MSNKTLKVASVKTVSAPKPYFWFIAPLLLLSLIAYFPVAEKEYTCTRFQDKPGYRADKTLTIAGQTIHAEEAMTPDALQKGLSARPCMRKNQAMLFTFPAGDSSEHCFWMKDMRFPLDIIWLDETKRVVFSATDLSPQTYPKQYCPNMPTRYVLELQSGRANELGIGYDKLLSF